MRILIVLLLSLLPALPAMAAIYKYVDEEGRVTFTDMPKKGVKPAAVLGEIGKPAPSASASPKASTKRAPSPVNFPRIDDATQRKRDDVRRTVLEEELASEQGNLEEAKRQLAAGQKPLVGESASTPGFQQRLKQLRDAVERHERNISAIRKELGTVR